MKLVNLQSIDVSRDTSKLQQNVLEQYQNSKELVFNILLHGQIRNIDNNFSIGNIYSRITDRVSIVFSVKAIYDNTSYSFDIFAQFDENGLINIESNHLKELLFNNVRAALVKLKNSEYNFLFDIQHDEHIYLNKALKNYR